MNASAPEDGTESRPGRIIRWLGEVVLFTALGIVWTVTGLLLVWRPVTGPWSTNPTLAWLAFIAWLVLGGLVYGLWRPAGATLGKAVILAGCVTITPTYYLAGLPDDWNLTRRWLTPAEFAAWLWRGSSPWFGEGPYLAPWQHGMTAFLFLVGPIALGLLLGRLVVRRMV
jgi:hypothetical protein